MMLNGLYRTLTDLGAPLIRLYLAKRLKAGREDAARFGERLGEASVSRPAGKLIWCHAASVGEAASLLALITELRRENPSLTILVTTGTVTSARMLAHRLPTGVIHQFIPVDRVPYVRQFLTHWKPDMALWIESELWPNMLTELRSRHIPAVLLNGRMSQHSFRNWQRVSGWAKQLLGTFALILAQTDEDGARFKALGTTEVRCIGNLKFAAEALPCDEAALANLRSSVGARPLWVAASTHAGEEEIIVAAHRAIVPTIPDLLTIIVPRHAVRGDEIVHILTSSGLAIARRSLQQPITSSTQIYLADTMGELGLFYRLAPVVVMGGSLVAVGGHNPIEPAQLGAAIILGPHMHNFAAMTQEFLGADAAVQLAQTGGLAEVLQTLLTNTEKRDALIHAAQKLADNKKKVLADTLRELKPWLDRLS